MTTGDEGRPPLWVARLYVSDRTREKIASKHGLDVDEIRRDLVAVDGIEYRCCIRRPDLGEDAYRLGSAYRV